MTFNKKTYSELLCEKKHNIENISDEAVNALSFLDIPEKWFEAMAVCEAAVDAGKPDAAVLNLYGEMFLKSRELHSSMMLNDEDYAEWFEQVVEFNKKFAEANISKAWAELVSLYKNGRIPFRNEETAEKYLLEGVKLGDPLSTAIYGYCIYFGLNGIDADTDEGQKLMQKAADTGFERAENYLLLAEYTDSEEYELKLKNHLTTAKPENQMWHLLGNFYLDFRNDIDKSLEALNTGIKVANDHFCKYNKAMIVLNDNIKSDFDEALNLLQEAFEWGVVHAADFLGQFHYHNAEYFNADKAIEWYEKAVAYGNVYAMFNLAVVYLHDDERKDVKKAFEYLDMAIAENHVRAINEKAFFMLENEDFKDIPQAKKLLEKSCELEDGYAAFRLGLGYQNAEFSEERDYQTAFKYYTIGYERNNLYAMELMGKYYRAGLVDNEPNPEKAVEFYKMAIERDSNYARLELALCHEDGFGVEQSDIKAFELLKIAADGNYAYANTKLGYYYLNGIVSEPDFDMAFEHFTKAADEGEIDAMYNLGRMYKYSIGMPENPELALRYFTLAADGGNENANIEMALAYETEYGGLPFDPEKAMEYMNRAAEQGHPYALYKMGCYHYYALIEENKEKGLEYFNKSFEADSPWAALALGDHFLYNGEDRSDYVKAFDYYKYAEKDDYISEGLGLCYMYGFGTERNETEAFKYLSIAADRNYTSAKYRLGCCYKYGTGTVKNLVEAAKWLREAAEEGNPGGEFETGMLLLNGEGVPMNPEEGIDWLRKAAENEYDNAQFELGNCYLEGRGVEEDEAMAMYWYTLAAENGNEEAQKITGKRNKKRI